jgi:RNA polymerase sigma factor (sigma-70 family)
MRHKDPLSNPSALIRRVYSYVAYQLGDGPEAEDVTSEVFERALRYRSSYDDSRGGPLAWLFGIARRCVNDALAGRPPLAEVEMSEQASSEDLEGESVQRIAVTDAIERLDERGRELIAMRYGADLTARQIGEILGVKTNAVEVALHRTVARLRADLEGPQSKTPSPRPEPSPRAAP